MPILFNDPNSKFSPQLLTAIGTGLLSGNTWADQLANAGLGANQAVAAQVEKQKADAEKNQTVAALQPYPDLANAVSIGAMTPALAYGEMLKRKQAEAEAAKPKYQVINNKLVQTNGPEGQIKVAADFSDPNANIPASAKETNYYLTHPDAWTAYQQQRAALKDTGDDTFEGRKQIAAKLGLDPNDANTKQYLATGKFPKEDQQSLTAIDKKAIQEADDMVAMNQQAIEALKSARGISDKANSGLLADTRASIGANLPDWMVPDAVSSPESSTATLDYNNAIIGQALGQLKAIFGGNPTEGERAILLQLQGSANVPAEARQKILDRALEAAQRRLEYNKNKANDLRGGTYYKPGRVDATQPKNTGTTTSGLNWSVEP